MFGGEGGGGAAGLCSLNFEEKLSNFLKSKKMAKSGKKIDSEKSVRTLQSPKAIVKCLHCHSIARMIQNLKFQYSFHTQLASKSCLQIFLGISRN